MLTGSQAKSFAVQANERVSGGEHKSFSARRRSPYTNQTSYGQCEINFDNGALIINIDDTLYGTYHVDLGVYDVEIGVTCYVVVDEEAE